MKHWFLLLLLSFGAATAAVAQTAPLRIEAATPDGGSGTLTIAGAGFGGRPFVTLDLVPLNVQLALDQRVVAVVPVGMMPPGTYLLTVSRGPEPGDTASFEVRIGGGDPAPAPAASAVAALPPVPAPVTPAGGSALPSGSAAAGVVGDRTIAVADVDREWQRVDPVAHLTASRQLYAARRKVLTDLMNQELLSREAASRGVTVEALLAAELPARTIPLPDTSVTALYQSLGDRARGASLDQMRPALREWLSRKVEPELARMTYLEELTKVSTRADVLLVPPAVVVEHHADDPALGPSIAPVQLALFGDFQSPVYGRFMAVLPRVRELFGARLRVVFKHFPANDPASILAAEAAACANVQGKFWAFHDTLLGAAGLLDAARFKKVASDIGLDRTVFDRCLDTEATRPRIGLALEEAQRYDLPGPASILVNGRLAPEPPAFLPTFEYLKRLVEEELQRQAPAAR